MGKQTQNKNTSADITPYKSLFEIIGEIREQTNWFRLSSQYIIDISVHNLGRFLKRKSVRAVCLIILENANDGYNLDETIEISLQEFFAQGQTSKR